MPKYIAIMRYFDVRTDGMEMVLGNECVRMFYSDEQEDLWRQVDEARRECICIEAVYFHFNCGNYVKGA